MRIRRKHRRCCRASCRSFLSISSEDVEDQANVTVRFLQDQANKLQSQISQIEGQLTALKQRNGAALAGSGVPPLIDTGSLVRRSRRCKTRIDNSAAEPAPRESNSALAAAEAQLAAAEAQYSDRHPDVWLPKSG